jgi:MvaI/BcnI restriction endonuclease family
MTDHEGTYDTRRARELTLESLKSIFSDLGVSSLYIKKLAPNDNSKNQPYFGPHLTDLAFIPTGELVPSFSKSGKTSDPKQQVKYQAPINLSWVDANGAVYEAPNSKLIYYPQYPEVRFSGFLQGSSVKLSEWMDPYKKGRSEGRSLLLGVSPDQAVYAYLVTPGSQLAEELESVRLVEITSVFGQTVFDQAVPEKPTRGLLLEKLLEIHQRGWISSRRLDANGREISYKAPNGGGYTLEAMLGVTPNGFSQPDYLGWEVKQFGVTRFPGIGAKPTTLFTPEPDVGIYKDQGAVEFVRQYGYEDKSGISDRLNIGGRHVVNKHTVSTGLTLSILGFDAASNEITDVDGCVALLDGDENIAAGWTFAKLMGHWKRKHAQAVYVPCLRRETTEQCEYHYGSTVELGVGTSFELLLSSICQGNVYYDPGIKLEKVNSANPKLKRRSQFRINHRHISSLYKSFSLNNLANECS